MHNLRRGPNFILALKWDDVDVTKWVDKEVIQDPIWCPGNPIISGKIEN